jgi:hypothetical protein
MIDIGTGVERQNERSNRNIKIRRLWSLWW